MSNPKDASPLDSDAAFRGGRVIAGLRVLEVGDEGETIIIEGHPVDWRRPLAAFLGWARYEWGYGPAEWRPLPPFSYRWVTFEPHSPGCDWRDEDWDPAWESECRCDHYEWWLEYAPTGTGFPVVQVDLG